MALYKFVKDNGDIIEEEYVRGNALKKEQVEAELVSALKSFDTQATCIPVSSDLSEIYNVHVTYQGIGNITFCIKGVTPGGRSSGLKLKDEQRIQLKAKYMKYTYKQKVSGKKVFLLGVYKRESNTVFCAWNVGYPNAEDNIPISKQIKIDTIANAMREGTATQKKNNGEVAFAFRKDFFLRWLLEHSDERSEWQIAQEEHYEEDTEVCIEDLSLTPVDFEYIKQKEGKQKRSKSSGKPDYKQINENKTKLGRIGERLVLKYEQNKLDELEVNKLVKWVSEENDNEGYDILSYDSEGNEIHIEVKTSASSKNVMRFYLTKNEYDRLLTDPAYELYYVFDTKTSKPKLHILDIEGIRSGEIAVETEVYLANWDVSMRLI